MKRICTVFLAIIMMFTLVACGSGSGTVSGNNLATKYASFEVSSPSLKGANWIKDISNTDKGQNVSPELNWNPVEGATCYQIYMVDENMNNFIHWKAANVTETSLPMGWATKEYVGPYPPKGGEHVYSIYVIATKNEVERLKGSVNSQNDKFPSFLDAVDTDIDGNTGNIISVGYLAGNFKN